MSEGKEKEKEQKIMEKADKIKQGIKVGGMRCQIEIEVDGVKVYSGEVK